MTYPTQIYKDMISTEGVKTSVLVILQAIKNGRWKKEVEEYRKTRDSTIKENLPCFTVGGVFHPTKSVANLQQQNNLLSIDLDDIEEWEGLDDELDSILGTSLLATFKSAGGNGLCLLIQVVDFEDEAQFKRLYYSIYTRLNDTIGKSCKVDYLPNLNRLRFVSYDPYTYINEEEIEPWGAELEPPEQTELPLPKKNKKLVLNLAEYSEEEKYKITVERYVEATGDFGSNGKPRHDWVLGLARWTCRAGIDEHTAVTNILRDYHNPSRAQVWATEVKRCVRDSYKTYRTESGQYEPTKKFSFDDILSASNVEQAREQLLFLIVDKINYQKYLESEGKMTTFVKKEIKFLEILNGFL
jgi:hypothetical protein